MQPDARRATRGHPAALGAQPVRPGVLGDTRGGRVTCPRAGLAKPPLSERLAVRSGASTS